MIELDTTRANPLVDSTLHVWGWEIPVYLFLGGLVAGTMILSGYLLASGRWRARQSVSPVLPAASLVLLSLGMLALFLDLEHKAFVWRLYTTFQPTSPMSWGAWILVLVYPVLIANLWLTLPSGWRGLLPALGAVGERWRQGSTAESWIGRASMIGGALLGIYTGILLSALGARPLWSSALLGPLFLVSGLSAAAAFVHLLSRDPEERRFFANADNAFLVAELVLLGLLLIGLSSSTAVHERAAALLLGGPFTALFWVGVVGVGIVLPLVVQALELRHRIAHTGIAPLLVMAGGLGLRFVIVQAGQVSHWVRLPGL